MTKEKLKPVYIKDIAPLSGCYSARDVGDLNIYIDADMVGALLLDEYGGGTHISQSMGNYLAKHIKQIIKITRATDNQEIKGR